MDFGRFGYEMEKEKDEKRAESAKKLPQLSQVSFV
jgi:translation initiation factor IF-3